MNLMEFPTENEAKQYLVKRYACGHFYVNQRIRGQVYYRRWVRLPKRYLKTFLPI